MGSKHTLGIIKVNDGNLKKQRIACPENVQLLSGKTLFINPSQVTWRDSVYGRGGRLACYSLWCQSGTAVSRGWSPSRPSVRILLPSLKSSVNVILWYLKLLQAAHVTDRTVSPSSLCPTEYPTFSWDYPAISLNFASIPLPTNRFLLHLSIMSSIKKLVSKDLPVIPNKQ